MAHAQGDAARRAARRALLRAAVYVVPAVLGTFVVARRAEAQASCLPGVSCRPDVCRPIVSCRPDVCRPVIPCRPSLR